MCSSDLLTAPHAHWTLLVLTQRESVASLCQEIWRLRAGELVAEVRASRFTEV